MEILKKIYKKLLLVIAYTIIASFVYGFWFHSLWHLWYVTLITIVVVFIIGAVIGYFYIKPDLKEEKEEEIKLNTPSEKEPLTEVTPEVENKE